MDDVTGVGLGELDEKGEGIKGEKPMDTRNSEVVTGGKGSSGR